MPRRAIALVALGMISIIMAPAKAEIKVGLAFPLTGPYAWIGDGQYRGAIKGIEHLNASGGVLGQPLQAILVDDFCDSEQALVAARKLVESQVPVVIGHPCSVAAIPASAVYEQAGIVFITPGSTNPTLTERGHRLTFRLVGRDDLQGAMIGDYLADAWSNKNIAIVHDGEVYGEGIAEEVRRRLRERGVREALYEAIALGQTEFLDLVGRLQDESIDVLFFGGFTAEGGLLVRQARGRLPGLQIIVPDGVGGADFPLIAGEAVEGVLMTTYPDVRQIPAVAELIAEFEAEGYEIQPFAGTITTYAILQVWAQAVTQARSSEEPGAIATALRSGRFETIYGSIGFDDKGDVIGFETFDWYVWKDGRMVLWNRP